MNMISLSAGKKSEHLVGAAMAALALVVYLLTLCPTVNYIDSGELATVIKTLGIAHPTGYPFFTLLGHCFADLPLGLRPVYQANLFAAVLCASALAVYFRLFLLLLGQLGGRDADRRVVLLGAASGTLLLGFSETYWSQALSVEVYSLHALFLAVLLLLVAQAILEPGLRPAAGRWMLFAYVLGLAFTNHMTTILLAPAVLVGFFSSSGGVRSRNAWRRIAWMVLPFLAGLSVYLYLPIRSASEPLMNWGHPVDLERLWWHFTGKVYRVWIFSSFDSAGKQFSYFTGTLPGEMGYLALPLVVAGLWSCWRRHRQIAIVSLLLFATCVGYSINYDIHDIDAYFLLAYIVMAFWAASGVQELARRIPGAGLRQAAAAAGLIVAALGCTTNYGRVDQSRNTAVERYARDVFRSVPQGALVLSYQWDYFVSAAYYLQVVEGYRPDVAVVDKELLRRSWYLHMLGARYPQLFASAQPTLAAFREQLSRFEHDLPYNPAVIERMYAELIRAVLVSRDRTYVTPEIEPDYTKGMERFPTGLVFSLRGAAGGDSAGWVLAHVPPFGATDMYGQGIESMYLRALVNQGVFSMLSGDSARARSFAQKALELSPNDESARILLSRLVQPR